MSIICMCYCSFSSLSFMPRPVLAQLVDQLIISKHTRCIFELIVLGKIDKKGSAKRKSIQAEWYKQWKVPFCLVTRHSETPLSQSSRRINGKDFEWRGWVHVANFHFTLEISMLKSTAMCVWMQFDYKTSRTFVVLEKNCINSHFLKL